MLTEAFSNERHTKAATLSTRLLLTFSFSSSPFFSNRHQNGKHTHKTVYTINIYYYYDYIINANNYLTRILKKNTNKKKTLIQAL